MREKVVSLIKGAGVVGAGGAGFPTHVKVQADAEYVVVNGAECEPLLRVDQQLMALYPDLIIRGLEAVLQATGASQGIIALKAKYHEAIHALEKRISGKPIKLFILDDFYPAGDEQITVYEALKRVVPEGGIPIKVGCVVDNVETLLNVARAMEGKPVTHTYVTITGDVPKPITVKLPIGMTVAEALRLAGVNDPQGKVVIDGGPMMGNVIDDVNQPVTKLTKGLIVLREDHPLIQRKRMPLARQLRQAKAACCQCTRCTEICPRHLLGHSLRPHLVMRAVNHYRGSEEVLKMSLICSQCGACEYVCPMDLSPRQVNVMLKQELGKKGIKASCAQPNPVPNPYREYRKIPGKRLMVRLGLTHFDQPAPLTQEEFSPAEVKIPLKQHIGVPSVPKVKVGDQVSPGDLLAQVPEGALGANVHASIGGIVKEISDYIVISSAGRGGAN